MTFANPLPWWALLPVVLAAALVAWQAYRRFNTLPARRHTLTGIRFVTLLVLVLVLMRPVARSTDFDARDAVVPILVDTSRSMGIEDADGATRIARARELVSRELMPALDGRFQTELLAFGESLAPAALDALGSAARRSDLAGALAAVRERYRGRPVAGIVLISDGGDTGGAAERSSGEPVAPVYPFGVGSENIGFDREVLSVTAAEAVLDESRVDLAVSAVSHGAGKETIELRLLENGRPIEVRRVATSAAGGPVREIFHVAPANGAATVYTVEIPAASGELVPENNMRSVLVQPPGRQRRVLLVEGAPGFEHSFLKRALAGDRGLELDSVVRKGVNEQGADTFYIQAARSRSDALTTGFPATPQSLFIYDAIVFGNVAGSQLTTAQLEMARDFVARRGGGLLVLGAQSFLNKGLVGTAIEDALPVTLNQRADTPVPAASRAAHRVAVTEAGLLHPIMQIAASAEETRKRWDGLPALAAAAGSGAVRPGGTVLATTTGAGSVSRALVAVQRYGEGRSMVFTGEASWRWRMMLPSTDRAYETFWRQAVRWLAIGATDPVAIFPAPATATGDEVSLRAAVRDQTFQPLTDAEVEFRVYGPDGKLQRLDGALENIDPEANDAAFAAKFRPDQAGIYKVTAHARRGGGDAGTSSASFLVGGADVEMTDPRLNTPLLARVASASGGQVFASGQTAELLEALRANAPSAALAVRQDLWHNAWSLLVILSLLAGEWLLRRRWGLR